MPTLTPHSPTIPHSPTVPHTQGKVPTQDNLVSIIAAQVRAQGPVFQLPAVRPTFIFSGMQALSLLDDMALVERDLSAAPRQAPLIRALSDDAVAVLSFTNGEEHQRRRSSWMAPGNLDQAGILKALPVIAAVIDRGFSEWKVRGIFSLNMEVRTLAWRIATQLMLGLDTDDSLLADYEIFMGLDDHNDIDAAKERVIDFIKGQIAIIRQRDHHVDDCIAAKLVATGLLNDDELINEIKHGLGSLAFTWAPVSELLRQLSFSTADAIRSREEVTALANAFTPRAMASTPHLMRLIDASLRITSPIPLVFAKAKISFTAEGVDIPAGAVLIGAYHATNQMADNPSSEFAPSDNVESPSKTSDHVAFGVGSHRCPGADLSTVILWQFAVRYLAHYRIELLDEADLPSRDDSGYHAHGGCFARFYRCTAPLPNVNTTTPAYTTDRNTGTAPQVANSDNAVDRSQRIAIVGAGITGLTLAYELRQRGYTQVTVLERAPSVGGKADTVDIAGRPYNVGAHLCHGNLGVAYLAKQTGVEMERVPGYQHWDIDNNRAIPRSYEHYEQVRKLRHMLETQPGLEHGAGFAVAESWTYPAVQQWLDAQGLKGLTEIGPFFAGAGYGLIKDDIPAGFFLKFAQHMIEDVWTPAGGFKNLLLKIAEGLDVRCNTEVVSIERATNADDAPGNGPIRIATRHCSSGAAATVQHQGNKNLQHETFDQLILTAPLDTSIEYLDVSEEEQTLFARIQSLNYYTLIATLDIEQPHTPGLYIVNKNTTTAFNKGHTTAFMRLYEDSNVYHFFCYGESGQRDESILDALREDAEKLGGRLSEVHYFKRWNYAPRVSPHDMALGFYSRLDQMQGRRNTFYAGSLLAFELTDHNVMQARKLVDRYFGERDQSPQRLNASELNSRDVARNKLESQTNLPENGIRSILDILVERYQKTPHATYSTFLDAQGKIVRALTYKELVGRAMACAIALRDKGVAAGDRVALVYPPDTDEFLVGFFGCLFVEAIAVPVACPDPRKLDIEIPRFAHLMRDCDCRVALTTRVYHAIALAGRTWSAITNIASTQKVKWPKLNWLSTDGLSPVAPDARRSIPSPRASTLAYLQYTSGSTSNPRGVMIDHGNILDNVNAISVQTKVDAQSVLVGWVPLFHDMGLVGGPLTALYSGAHMVFFSPMSFLQNPMLWIKAIHRFRGTHTESPNFGYEFLLRHLKGKSLEGIDLSCLKYTLFGGEVMRPQTFSRMTTVLNETGFRAESMTNIFGAAEGTLYLAGGGIERTPLLSVDTYALQTKRRAIPKSPNLRSTTTLIGCGIPALDSDLRIIDPVTTRLLPDGEVGEVWISSPSISRGYWGKPEEQNEQTFRACVAHDDAPLRTYLRTGDLGFVIDNILYICGRVKEMMIFNGRNIHPMDIELCVMQASPAIRQGCVVAFSVEEQNQERLIIVAEVKQAAQDVAARAVDAIAQVLANQHSLACKEIVLVRSGTLPKTSSGKLQRYLAKEHYVNGDLERVHSLTSNGHEEADLTMKPSTEMIMPDELNNQAFTGDLDTTIGWLQQLLAVSLRVSPEEIDTNVDISMFGIDSAQALALTSRIARYVGEELTPSIIYERPTIDALARYLCSSEDKSRVLIQLQTGNAAKFPNLFCVHPVGGSAMAYLGLVKTMDADMPVYAFSNERGIVPSDDLVAMAEQYVLAMRNVQPKGPYHLLGYSFGGIVAYEMARQLMLSGEQVGGLYLIDSPAPLYGESTQGPRVSGNETFANFFETAILNRLIPDQLADDERERMRIRIDQNHRALAEYRIATDSTVWPSVKMLRASEEAMFLRDTLQHPAFDSEDFGWGTVAPGAVLDIAKVPGDHFSMMNEPQALVHILCQWLAAAE